MVLFPICISLGLQIITRSSVVWILFKHKRKTTSAPRSMKSNKTNKQTTPKTKIYVVVNEQQKKRRNNTFLLTEVTEHQYEQL